MGIFLLLTLPRVGARAQGENGEIQVWLRYGRIRIRVYPLPRAFQKKKEDKPKKPAAAPSAPSDFDLSNLDLGDTVCLLLDMLDDLRDIVRIDILRADVMIATGDAAKTGMLLGECSALVGMITPFLENTFSIKEYHIVLDGDFESNQTRWKATLAFSARPIRFFWALWKRRRTILQLYHTLKQPENPGSFIQKDGGETP